jgi:hypothetical protein
MGTKNQTSTTNTAPNPQAGAAYQSLLQRASGVADTPYQSYNGELVAPVNAQQNLGIGNINQGAGFAQPYIQQAAQYATNAAQPLTAEDIARYSDPYTQQVINATEGQFAHDNAVQQQGVLGNAAAQGALGGNRVGVAQALTAEGQQRAQAPVIAGLRSQGYNTGLNTAMNQQQQQAQAAYSLGNLGTAGQNAYLTGANAQIGAGTLQQGTQQALNAANYGQFTQAQAFPYQQAQWLAGIDTGVGSQMGGTSQTTKPGPNLFSQIAGLGMAGVGAFTGNPGAVTGGLNTLFGGGNSAGNYGGSPATNPNLNPASFGNLQNPYSNPYVARGGRIEGFDSGGAVVPYGGVGMPYAGAGPSWMPQAQITHGRGMAGVAGGMEDAPSSPGVAKIMSDATMLARKFMSQPGGQAFGGAVSPPSSDSIMLPRGYQDGGTPTMAGFGSGSMVPQDFNMFDPNPTPTYENGFPPEDRPPSQWESGKLREVPFDPASFAPGTFGMATPEDQPPDPYIGGRDEAYRAAIMAAGDDPYGAIEARGGVGDSSPEAPAAGVGNSGGWSSGIGPALMSAGFGMMASQSPHIGTAIGEGGLAGLKTYTEGQQREVANRRAEATMARQDAQTNIQQKSLDLRVRDLRQRRDQAQAALKAQSERQQEALKAQQQRHTEDLAARERALREGKMPPGFRTKEDGTLEAIPGGPHDPTVIAAQSKAKLPGAGEFRTDVSGDEFLATLPPGEAGLIKKLANYEIDPKTLSTRGGEREAALRKVAQYDPTFDQKRYNTIYSAVNKFATGKQGDTVRSFNVGIAHLDTLEGLIGALNNKDYPAFNRLANYVKTQTGSEAPGNFDAARDIVGKEIVKAVVGAGGGVEERREVAERMAAAKSPQQLLGVINTYKELMSGQVRGIKKQYEDATGLKNFDDKLMPETIRQLKLHESGGAGPKAPVRVTTPAEAQKLEPGTHYIGPDDKERIR